MHDNQASIVRDIQSQQAFLARIVIASLVVLAFFAANIPLEYVERNLVSRGAFRISGSQSSSMPEMPTMGGWPMRYLIQYPDEDQARYYSIIVLLSDIAIALAVGAVVFWIVRYREFRIMQSSNRRRTQKVFDLLFATVILLLPVVILGAAKLSSERQQRILRLLDDESSVELSCWFPKLFADKIPSPLHKHFLRPRGVNFLSADANGFEIAKKLPGLVGLGFYRCDIPDDLFRHLSNHRHLSQLSLIRQPISPKNAESIASLNYIKRLTLNGNDLTIDVLNKLRHWDKLTLVDLDRNEIELSKFDQPVWARTVTHLSLSRPWSGASDELTIKDWPQLQQLSVRRRSRETNDSTLTVRLANLPSLETLLLDRHQKHSLDFEGLPVLQSISDMPESMYRMTSRDVWVPSGCWVESLRLNQLPSLSQCNFFARDLHHLELDELPNCDFIEFSSELVSSGGWVKEQVGDGEYCQPLIDVLGKGNGPRSLILQSLPLGNLDLSPLKNNLGIQRLRFIGCGIDANQVQDLSPMKHLIELDLDECVLGQDQLRRLMLDFPNLEVLRASGMALKQVDLVEPSHLKELQLNRLGNVESLRMIDQHALNAELRFVESPRTLIIKNAESLLGIVLEKPLKAGAAISGLRNLEWFAAGGPELDDQIVKQVLMCPDLDRLTLAYPNLSRAMLQQIGQATRLTALIIPGAGVDQDITDAWQSLQMLWEINLDESEIGGRTMRWLSKNESLRVVSFARAKIDASGLDALASLHRIAELSLSDVAVAYSDIAELLAGDALEHLDLSGCNIDEEMMQGLVDARSLRTVKLHRCGLSKTQIETLQSARPKLRVITTDDPIRRSLRSDPVTYTTDPKIGVESIGFSRSGGQRRSERSVFNTVAAPSSGGPLDLDQFRAQALLGIKLGS